MTAILPRVAQIIATECGADAATIDQATTFDALGLDSIGRVEIAMLIEDEFLVEIPPSLEDSWATVGDITGWLETAVICG
jgi:acyl carrier protein